MRKANQLHIKLKATGYRNLHGRVPREAACARLAADRELGKVRRKKHKH